MNSKVCQFTELCEKKHKSEVKKWNKTSHFYEEMLTYCFGLHWHSVQLKLLKQHENMAFLFLICRAGPGRYLFIIIGINSVKILHTVKVNTIEDDPRALSIWPYLKYFQRLLLFRNSSTVKASLNYCSHQRLFHIAYEGDFWSLCSVTFWQKVNFLISNAS